MDFLMLCLIPGALEGIYDILLLYIYYINTVVSHVFMVFKIGSEAIKVGFPEDRLHRK